MARTGLEYPDVHSLGWHVWLGVTITIVPATLLVAARFYTRIKSTAGLRADDWLIFAALLFSWATTVIRYVELLCFGLGYHANLLPSSMVENFQQGFLAVQVAYFTTAVLTKASILFLYKRIFGISKAFVRILHGLLVLIVAYFAVCLFTAILGCHPVSYFWDKHQMGWCINEVQFFRWNGIANLLLDILILLLPLPMVWRLQLKLKQKVALTTVFMLGGFACLASILRIAQFQKSHQVDPTYTTVDSGMWSSIEQCLGIICACLPTLRPLIKSRGLNDTIHTGPGRSKSLQQAYHRERVDKRVMDTRPSHQGGSASNHRDSGSESVVGLATRPGKGAVQDVYVDVDEEKVAGMSFSDTEQPYMSIWKTQGYTRT